MNRGKFLILLFICAFFPAVSPAVALSQIRSGGFRIGVGVNAGTSGVGGEVAVEFPVQMGLRAGYSFFPLDGYTFSFKLPEQYGGDGTASGIQASMSMDHVTLMADFYVSETGGFRITEGVWFGRPDFLRIRNTTPLPDAFNSIGIDVDGYSVHAKDGDISISMDANGVKPYVGVGYGRMRDNRRVSVSFDAGLLFTAGRGLWTMGYGLLDEKEVRISSRSVELADKGLLDMIGSLTAWPVMRVIIYFRII